ncbi:MAG TPA: Bcr/CflA family multidrug efflux MFS transporter [Stenomitos sp.]
MEATPHRAPSPGFIAILGALTAIAPMSIDMYLPALPTIGRELGADPASVQLTLAFFFIGLALGQLVIGPLSDRMNRKVPLLGGLGLYALASAGCAVAPSIPVLVAFRFLQAVGGCAALVISRAVVRDLYQAREAARVFSMMTLVMGVAPIVAPLVGGYVMLAFGWRAIFGVLVVFAIALMAASALFLPESHQVARAEVEPAGSILHDLRAIVTDRHFLGFALTAGFAQAGMFAYISASPFVFIEYFHVPARSYGWIFGANACALIFSSQVNGRLLLTHHLEPLLQRGITALVAVALGLAVLGWTGWGGFWGVFLPLMAYMACLGFVFSNAMAAALAGHGRRAGLAAAVLGTLQYGLAALSGGLVGRLHSATAGGMVLVMAACALLAFTAHRMLAKPTSP